MGAAGSYLLGATGGAMGKPSSRIRMYIDKDAHGSVAAALHQHSDDVPTVREAGRRVPDLLQRSSLLLHEADL
jgi:hypothetical protein